MKRIKKLIVAGTLSAVLMGAGGLATMAPANARTPVSGPAETCSDARARLELLRAEIIWRQSQGLQVQDLIQESLKIQSYLANYCQFQGPGLPN